MRPIAKPLTLACTLLTAAALPLTLGAQSVSGAEPPAATTPAIPTAERPFTVRVTGHGPALLLIPGLMSGGDVWDATVAQFSDRYQLHVVTLAGFAGVPAVAGPTFMARARDALLAYVTDRTLDRPVVVGHSLGGTLAYAMAAAAPEALGGVMAEFRDMMRQRYAAQLVMLPQAELVVAERAYHFIMLDDPTFFHATLERFLATTAACKAPTRAGGQPCRR